MAAVSAGEARLCLWLALALGAAYALIYPAFAPSQELAQFARARALALGQLIPAVDAQGAFHLVPAPRAETLDGYAALPGDPSARLDHAQWWSDLGARDAVEVRVAIAPDKRTPAPLLLHLPALWLGRALGLSTLTQLYMARAFGLVSYALLCALAVAWAGPVRPLFLALALTPAALTDAASVTGASLPYALSLLLAATFVRHVLTPISPRISPRTLAPVLLGALVVLSLWLVDPRPWVPPPDDLAARLRWPFAHPIAAAKLLGLTLFRRGDEAMLQIVVSDGPLAQQLRLSGVAITLLYGQLLTLLACGALHGALSGARASRLARTCAIVALLAGLLFSVALGLGETFDGASILTHFDGAAYRPLLPWLGLALAFGVRPIATRFLQRRLLTRVLLPIALLHGYALFSLFGRFHAATSLPFPS